MALPPGQIHPQLQAAPAAENWQVGLDAPRPRPGKVQTQTGRRNVLEDYFLTIPNYFLAGFASVVSHTFAETSVEPGAGADARGAGHLDPGEAASITSMLRPSAPGIAIASHSGLFEFRGSMSFHALVVSFAAKRNISERNVRAGLSVIFDSFSDNGEYSMSENRELEAKVRAIVHARRFSEPEKEELASLVDVRMDQFGHLLLVRKGAPVDFDLLRPSDTVGVLDVYDAGRAGKRRRFLELKNDPKYHGPIILAEGDSWFEYPFAKDLLNYAGLEYAVLSLARAGDTWNDIIDEDSEPEKKYSDGTPMGLLHTLRLPEPHRPFNYVMLSAGGNDLISQLRFCVYYDPKWQKDDYIIHGGVGGFDAILGMVIADYKNKIDAIVGLGKSVILHTYDYPNPKSNGQYIGYQLERYCNFPKGAEGLMRRTVNRMIDFFHDALAKLAKGNVHLINLRNTIGTDDYLNGPDDTLWKDEMHGNNEGFRRLWARMDKDLKKIF